MQSGRFDDLLDRAGQLDASRYAPFRVLVMDRGEVAELSWHFPTVQLNLRTPSERPMMFTSSGLGDEVVDRPRRELFESWFDEPGNWGREQDSFHRHRWPDCARG